jgi:hypothetical protein
LATQNLESADAVAVPGKQKDLHEVLNRQPTEKMNNLFVRRVNLKRSDENISHRLIEGVKSFKELLVSVVEQAAFCTNPK